MTSSAAPNAPSVGIVELMFGTCFLVSYGLTGFLENIHTCRQSKVLDTIHILITNRMIWRHPLFSLFCWRADWRSTPHDSTQLLTGQAARSQRIQCDFTHPLAKLKFRSANFLDTNASRIIYFLPTFQLLTAPLRCFALVLLLLLITMTPRVSYPESSDGPSGIEYASRYFCASFCETARSKVTTILAHWI